MAVILSPAPGATLERPADIPATFMRASDLIILSQDAIPVILAPNGTVATNGTITLGTALPTTYANAWVRLPAGAVVGGLAGLYFVNFSSTTVGVVTTTFADAATPFAPFIPASTVVATGSNSAYTQTTGADVTLANITVPAGMMGPNGALRFSGFGSWNNSAGAKVHKLNFGGTALVTTSRTTTTNDAWSFLLQNRSLTSQAHTSSLIPAAAVTAAYRSINTAVDQALTFTGQIAVATDYLILEAFTVEVLPS